MNIHTPYLESVFHPENFKNTISRTVRAIRKEIKNGMKIDCIVLRGMSGALVGPSVASKLRIPFLVTRKPEEKQNSHSYASAEGPTDFKSYVIIDDVIATGNTINKTTEIIYNFCPAAKFVAVFLYDSSRQYDINEESIMKKLTYLKPRKVVIVDNPRTVVN